MRVIALPEFLARAQRLLSKEERAEFAEYIGARPEAGKVIRSTVYLLTIYAKAQQADLTPVQKKAILRDVATLKGEK